MHFIQLALLTSFTVYQRDNGRKPFLAFKHGNDGDPDLLKEEQIARLTERHFIAPILATEAGQRPPKHCRVCYKKGRHKGSHYQCSDCPSNLGLCYVVYSL